MLTHMCTCTHTLTPANIHTYVHMYVHAHTFTHSYSLHTLPLSHRKQEKAFRAALTNLCLVGLDLIVDNGYHGGIWAILETTLNFFL